ncbi:MAG: TIM barrel protein [Planctomycetes bacterium]|nr:TIM barrel protein [Planctomycetota bacterium]
MNIFKKDNLTAWCIVPFDAAQRGPQERAQMLRELGIQQLAYDWRDQHIPTFDDELHALREHNIDMRAIYFLGEWPEDAASAWAHPQIGPALEFLQRNKLEIEVWMTYSGEGAGEGDEESEQTTEEQRYDAGAARVRVLAEIIHSLGCRMCIYNHGGWGGEPKTMLAIAQRLADVNLGIIYNFHHGHDHLEQMPQAFNELVPYLASVNLNGMNKGGPKILPVGSGEEDLKIMKMINDSGYTGPIGIIDHREDTDTRETLTENMVGLQNLLKKVQADQVLATY